MNSAEKTALILISPYVAVLIGFIAFPLAYNISLSLAGKYPFENFVKVVSDPVFPLIIYNTVLWIVGSVVFQILLALGLAVLLNESFRGNKLLRALIVIVPWTTPDVVAGAIWKWMFSDVYGVINDVMLRLGLISRPLPWLGDVNLARLAVIVANIWKGFPIYTLVFLAALHTIPRELYEAAMIDGASAIRRFIHITLPQIKPVITIMAMFAVIWTMNYFPLIYIMTGGGPANATDTFTTYAYRLSFKFLHLDLGATWATLTFLVNMVFTIIYVRLVLR